MDTKGAWPEPKPLWKGFQFVVEPSVKRGQSKLREDDHFHEIQGGQEFDPFEFVPG